MTDPYSDDNEARRLREKYRNAPIELVDRPQNAAPTFDDVPTAQGPLTGPLPGPSQMPGYGPQPGFGQQQGPAQPGFGQHPGYAPGPPPGGPGYDRGNGAPPPEWAPTQPAPPSAATTAASYAGNGNLDDSTRSARIGTRTEGPQQGWRATANRFGIRVGKGADEIDFDRRVMQMQRTLRTPKTIAVISGKGSGSKTITTLAMGATLATYQRGLKIVAASIDPLGNITDRTRGVNTKPARSMVSLASDPNLQRESYVSNYLLTDKSGLRVLGSSSADSAGFLTTDHLDRAHEALGNFDITLLDFGLNIDSPVYHRGLALADQLVIVAATTADSIDELHKLIAQLKRFDNGVYADLIHNAVVVFTQTQKGKSFIDISAERDRIVNSYQTPVVTIPWDEHISEGGPVSLDLMDKDTRLPFIWLASEVMSKLPD